jgi:hypothetical protein
MDSSDRTDTRVLIPAPPQTRQETGVVWFEASFDPRQATARVTGFAARDRALSTLEARIFPDARVTGVISNGDSSVTIEIRGQKSQPGDVRIEGLINEQPFMISGAPGEAPHVEAAGLNLDASQKDLFRPWRELSSSLEALVEPLREPVHGFTTFGCTACLTIGAIVVQSAELCVAGDNPGACGVLIDSYTTFQHGCDPPPCT